MIVSLKMDDKEFLQKQALNTRKAQVVLPMTEALLKEHGLSLGELTGIEVNTGPGSFTGLRVGVAIANTLGYLLQIPVNGQAIGKPAEAIYN